MFSAIRSKNDHATQTYQLLLVEDNTADANLLMKFLEQSQFPCHLHWVKDGEQALDYCLKRHPFAQSIAPDVVILDLGLPKIDGKEVLRLLRQNEEFKNLPVIVLTTSETLDDVFQCIELGANSYLTKPSDLNEFDGLIRQLTFREFPRLVKGFKNQS